MKTFIIIPCYNESAKIVEVLNSLKGYGQIVVVDDGSTDESYNLAKSQNVIVLRHLINRGMGAALETGNRFALKNSADIVVHFDADGQHQAVEIPKLIQPIIENQAEATLGSRFLGKDNQTPKFKKWFILRPAIIFQRIMFGAKLTDAHNGFRALSNQALRKIKITQDGMAHNSEIIEQLVNKKIKFKEVPDTILYHEFGQGFADGLKILRDLIIGKLNK